MLKYSTNVVTTPVGITVGLDLRNADDTVEFNDIRSRHTGVHAVLGTLDYNPDFSEDGRYLLGTKVALSSSIDDSMPYRQGVEIRVPNAYALGTFKILSGDPGHRNQQSVFGENETDVGANFLYRRGPTFRDNQKFDPIAFLAGTHPYPLLVDNQEQSIAGWGLYQEALEPLAIRSVASLQSPYFPFDVHRIWGDLEGGNVIKNHDADRVLSSDVWDTERPEPFLDMGDPFDWLTLPTPGFFIFDPARILPFEDRQFSRSVEESLTGGLLDVLRSATGSYDAGGYNDGGGGYVPDDHFSHGCGFTYDGSVRGADSLAFGGMEYV